jgi:hypothetical protein
MAAENDTPPKDNQQAAAGGRRKAGVTLDLAAEASSDQPQAAAGSATTAAGDMSATAGEEGRPEGAGPRADDAAPPPTSASPGPTRTAPPLVAFVLAGVVGGVVALALGYGLQATGVLPTPGLTTANEARTATEGLKDTVSGLDQRLTSIEAASAQAIADRALLDDLSRQVGVVDALGESLSDRLLKAEAAMAALKDDTGGTDDSDMQQTLDSLSKRVMRLETMPPPAAGDSGAQQQLDALSKRVERLETMPSSSPSTPAAEASAPVTSAPPANNAEARAAALTAFRLAATGGAPFADALANLDKLGVDPATIAALKPLAEKGVPTRAQLVDQFPKVADAILATEPAASDDAGLLDRLTSYGRSLVKVRPAGSPAGEETVAILERMRSAVDAGNLAKALNERKALPAKGQAASETWAGAVADRLEIDRLAEAIAAPPGASSGSG